MLAAKLKIPLTCSSLVHRNSLYERLCARRKKKLTLVSAQAGFGKSTLLCDWIKQNKVTTVWYAIDKNDNDPAEFLKYLIAAIQTIHKEFGQNSLELINSSHRPGIESLAGLLINDLQNIKSEFVLVLDDFHQVSSKEINSIVSFFLDYMPVNMHIIISTRSYPSIPLARFRSLDQLNEFRASDLGFSDTEIHELFNRKLKPGLTKKDIQWLEIKTEGWIAGLRLAAISLKTKDNISELC